MASPYFLSRWRSWLGEWATCSGSEMFHLPISQCFGAMRIGDLEANSSAVVSLSRDFMLQIVIKLNPTSEAQEIQQPLLGCDAIFALMGAWTF